MKDTHATLSVCVCAWQSHNGLSQWDLCSMSAGTFFHNRAYRIGFSFLAPSTHESIKKDCFCTVFQESVTGT